MSLRHPRWLWLSFSRDPTTGAGLDAEMRSAPFSNPPCATGAALCHTSRTFCIKRPARPVARPVARRSFPGSCQALSHAPAAPPPTPPPPTP
eukprot:CAMPEP_0185514476 /NCGR_PEP_ID=MMETSP1366-20130426/59386_1 /TAXON_ID=38817 /ORGANISM="Gephyrocapsa oceanica, Strain RCC1303" /LENGTH=91 /DNA_ID=CAMNT_0028125241 /DNA_START=35 /DNA_END=306 /DNA_ORIENTATION=+